MARIVEHDLQREILDMARNLFVKNGYALV